MANDYTQLPTTNTVSLTDKDIFWMNRSRRWVIFLCFIQLIVSWFTLLSGNLLVSIVTVIFSSLGLSGVRRSHVRLLTAHFVYSLIMYIFSLIALVGMFVYCQNCRWWSYLLVFLFVMFQAIGLRYSRMLIALIKNNGDSSFLAAPRCSWMWKRQQSTECCATQTNVPLATIETQTPTGVQAQTPTAPEAPKEQYPIAQQQFAYVPMPMQNMNMNMNMPYIPMRYPMMQQPITIMPQYMQPAPQAYQQQQQQQVVTPQSNLYPVVYKAN